MRSFELKVSAPRGREDAAGEQTGRERPEGERDRDALGDRVRRTWEGDRATKKAFSQTFRADAAPLHMFTFQREGRPGQEERARHAGRRGEYKTVN